jgi:hypothetical protein
LAIGEENTLVKWILDSDKRGLPLRPAYVKVMANHLLSQRGHKAGQQEVGINWVYNLVKRRAELKSRFSRRYNHERAKNEDPKIIKEWFDRVREVQLQYGILPDDIYNFDETGFAMGLIATAKVITSSDRVCRPNLLQPGNREWVTAIESVNALGWALPPYIIFKASTVHQHSWFESLPDDWRLDISKNGWTTDVIGLKWLTKMFIPATTARTKGSHRLLVLDGHGSHLTPQFDQICAENNIIPICMPPHASHLLQPLDVGCFAVLKREYGRLVEQRMRHGFNHIDKLDFLTNFPAARLEAYKPANIQNGFMAAGLVPYNPDRVYQQLNVQLKTPTPPPNRSDNLPSSGAFQTPSNLHQLERHSTAIKSYLMCNITSPSSPINQVFDRMSRAAENAISELVIAKKEIKELRASHEKEKQKRTRSTSRFVHEGGLTREEAQELINVNNQPVEPTATDPAAPEQPTPQPRKRAPKRCSECGTIGHTRMTCSKRNAG